MQAPVYLGFPECGRFPPPPNLWGTDSLLDPVTCQDEIFLPVPMASLRSSAQGKVGSPSWATCVWVPLVGLACP